MTIPITPELRACIEALPASFELSPQQVADLTGMRYAHVLEALALMPKYQQQYGRRKQYHIERNDVLALVRLDNGRTRRATPGTGNKGLAKRVDRIETFLATHFADDWAAHNTTEGAKA